MQFFESGLECVKWAVKIYVLSRQRVIAEIRKNVSRFIHYSGLADCRMRFRPGMRAGDIRLAINAFKASVA